LSIQSPHEDLNNTNKDFNGNQFAHFNFENYATLNNINDWHFRFALESFFKISFLRKLQQDKNQVITYKTWQSFLSSEAYTAWCNQFIKEHFSAAVTAKYHADFTAWLFTFGFTPDTPTEISATNSVDKKYIQRIEAFENLIENGLANETYNLNENSKILDEVKLEKLLKQHQGKPIFIVFWSARFAGASMIKHLPAFKDFENRYGEKAKVLYICIDQEKNKKLWAARIIDNAWKSTHFFIPEVGNTTVLQKFSSQKIGAFCNGGATFAFIDVKGTINYGVKSIFEMSKEEINKMLN
jgi:hypothetical protein